MTRPGRFRIAVVNTARIWTKRSSLRFLMSLRVQKMMLNHKAARKAPKNAVK
jgi:hypothetical protein